MGGVYGVEPQLCPSRAVPWVLSLCLLLATGSANAANQGITGKKLLLKGASKFVLLSKDASIHVSGSPACPAADSSLAFDDGVHAHTFALPCANWSDSGTVARYKNSSAPSGPSEVRVAKDKAGLVEVIGKGLGGFPVPDGAATIDVVLNLGGTTERYCMSFSGVGDGSRFLVKNAPTGTCPVCGNDTVDPGETCDGTADAACPGHCQPDCTCPTPMCGNNVQEGTEACDGTDATACPNDCLPDCTCAAACPATQGDATACLAYGTISQCSNCCSADEECLICTGAYTISGCTQAAANDACSLAINLVGCAAECCP